MLDQRAGFASFWLVQIGFNVTFLGMFAAGLAGQPRRVEHYDSIFGVANLVSTLGAYVIGLGMVILLYAVVSSWRHGTRAPANPWGSKTLEWTVPNPIPLENFEVLPVVIADPYGYGEGDLPVPVPRVPAPAEVGAGADAPAGDAVTPTGSVLTATEPPPIPTQEQP
jgi:cytochrome c oxidase subunit 1